jgi:hypothetical protein
MRAGVASFFQCEGGQMGRSCPACTVFFALLSGSESLLQTFAIKGKYKFRWNFPRFCGSTRNPMPKIYSCCSDLSICVTHFRAFVQIWLCKHLQNDENPAHRTPTIAEK